MNSKKTIIITGGAGFIGSALIRYIINNTDFKVVNVDKLTYSGNLESLGSISQNNRYSFEKIDICDGLKLEKIIFKNKPDLIIHLRPTYPIRSARVVDKAIKFALRSRKYDSIRSVCEPVQNPYKMWRINKNNFLIPMLGNFKKELYNSPRQILQKTYWQNAYLDIIKYNLFLR